MNRNLFIFSLTLIVVGLLGVSVVQGLWLKAAIENREADFDQRVYESMEEIAYGIENLNYQPYIDELIKDMKLDTNAMREFDNFRLNDSLHSSLHPESSSKKWDSQIDRDEFAKVYASQIREFQEMLVREMITLRPLDEILDIKQLKPYIEKTLVLHGIKTEFNVGITEFADNNFVYVSPGSDLGALFHTPYTTKLFRKSIIDGNKLLKINFPERKQFLLHSFLMPIFSSILFMLMIIVSFIVSFKIIFHQKRLSDMKTDFINNMTH